MIQSHLKALYSRQTEELKAILLVSQGAGNPVSEQFKSRIESCLQIYSTKYKRISASLNKR